MKICQIIQNINGETNMQKAQWLQKHIYFLFVTEKYVKIYVSEWKLHRGFTCDMVTNKTIIFI
jgi:hypothetical protein